LKQPAKLSLDYLLYTEGEEVACHSRRSITVRGITKADFIAWEAAFTFFRFTVYLISPPKYNSYT
jgi:hypothetical protein